MLFAACNRDSDPDAWDMFKNKYADKGTTIRLNGLMRLGLRMFAGADQDPKTRALMNIVKKMKGVEIHIIPVSQAHYSSAEVIRLSDVRDKSRYKSLVSVRKGSQLVNLWARGDDNTFKDPLTLIHDGDDLIMIEMKGTLTTDDLRTLTQAGMKYSKGD